MKKDIVFPKVENIAVAIAVEEQEGKDTSYTAYLINSKDVTITNVLINASGYGEMNGEQKTTATVRYFREELAGNSAMIIESILPEVFNIANEYWVSFYENGSIYDKKFIFLPASIQECNFTTIPIINKKGVLIK